MNQEERQEAARLFLGAETDLAALDPWDLVRRFGLPWRSAERLLDQAGLDRGTISLADLPQHRRRVLVDPAKLDLHAIAAGPIMDSNQLYLPAGRISTEEAKAREAASMLPPDQ